MKPEDMRTIVQIRTRSMGKSIEVLVAMDAWMKAALVGDRLVVASEKDVRVFELVEVRKEKT